MQLSATQCVVVASTIPVLLIALMVDRRWIAFAAIRPNKSAKTNAQRAISIVGGLPIWLGATFFIALAGVDSGLGTIATIFVVLMLGWSFVILGGIAAVAAVDPPGHRRKNPPSTERDGEDQR